MVAEAMSKRHTTSRKARVRVMPKRKMALLRMSSTEKTAKMAARTNDKIKVMRTNAFETLNVD